MKLVWSVAEIEVMFKNCFKTAQLYNQIGERQVKTWFIHK